ncbi:acyl carrier protein [Kutzneria kofuensis]|jgi:act minimal PKS acyl carrier protein|uniref:Act minimal PKS acyl carrier protein n=1 Tax=Kutzneria kofuensis TaxID=103725 RepID=A0A7W9KCX5_9PSEU|nr:acyl carrier protein [Kutzneria kofuensis]MBB5890236.1 act minimal PKS acyl carrier protein [Kutzneria kofuensis]
MPELTLIELLALLRACAGEDESHDLTGDVLDTPFAELGYDSIALLETTSRIERDYGVELSEDAVAQVLTPAEFLELVNDNLRSVRS